MLDHTPPSANEVATKIIADIDALIAANVTTPDMGLSQKLAKQRLVRTLVQRLLADAGDHYILSIFCEYVVAANSLSPMSQDEDWEQLNRLADLREQSIWVIDKMHTDAGLEIQ